MKYFTLFLFFVVTNQLFATAQYGDLLIIEDDTTWITSNPLELYFNEKGTRDFADVEMMGFCTALWRGYVATWKLENDSLFLVRLQTNYCGNDKIELDLTKEFGTDRVFAKWYNSIIVKPEGDLLMYVHMGYMSIYEGEVSYSFENGCLVREEMAEFLVENKKMMHPSISF